MKNLFLRSIGCILLLAIHFTCSAQNNSRLIKSKEDTLKHLGSQIVNAEFAEQRFRADSHFTRVLVRALQTPYSFQFPFDSVSTISRLYSPDSSFRIFTWQVSRDPNTFRRHGAIQMKTNDGSLKLFPLIDRSQLINNQSDTVMNNEWWIGSIYYKILVNEHNNQKIYTLLGYDEFSARSTRKRIEILTFNASGGPVFGKPIFVFSNGSLKKNNTSRYWIEYKKNTNASIKYDSELNMIIFDHLVSETSEAGKYETYVPDGDYEAFKFENGKWIYIEKPFDFKLQDGQAPVEKPVLESKFPQKKSGKKGI